MRDYSEADSKAVKAGCIGVAAITTAVAFIMPPVFSRVCLGLLTYGTARYVTEDPSFKESVMDRWNEKFGNEEEVDKPDVPDPMSYEYAESQRSV